MEHIIIESHIPFARGLFEAAGASVEYLAPDRITPGRVRRATAMMVRTRTRCDRTLLQDSPCRIVASATIGLDHVDIPWCEDHGIRVANAPGCNAPAVAQYVFASIAAATGLTDLDGMTLGVIGAGHVGSIVSRWAEGMGMKVLVCDPPRSRREGPEKFSGLERIAAEAQVITVHTPYTRTGPDATHHLLGQDFFAALRRAPIVINSARGPITDTLALNAALRSGKISKAIIDCWEGEPDIDRTLLESASVATPHIAGYSLQGKMRATAMAATAIAHTLGLKISPELPHGFPSEGAARPSLKDITASYDPMADTSALRANPGEFERLRNGYALRSEVGI